MKAPLVLDDFKDDAAKLGCDVAAVRAVAYVESRGSGFDPEDFPKTLFEGHWFHRFTQGKFAEQYPTLSFPKQTRKFYGKTWKEEKDRLALAITLDREAALKSASWGMFQIMGFNYGITGFNSVQAFVNSMCQDHNSQLAAFTNYVLNSGLADELRDRRWIDFAKRYNGSEYWRNNYDTKLADAYSKYLQMTY